MSRGMIRCNATKSAAQALHRAQASKWVEGEPFEVVEIPGTRRVRYMVDAAGNYVTHTRGWMTPIAASTLRDVMRNVVAGESDLFQLCYDGGPFRTK